MPRTMSIAENLSRIRKEAGLSQRALADESGVSQQLISQIERGENNSTKHLAALARALRRPLTDFDSSLTDVMSEDPFLIRYGRLSHDDKLIVQALVDRLERGREEEHPSTEGRGLDHPEQDD